MIGVATTLGFGPVPHARWPRGVSTETVFIALATACLSLGLPLAFSAAAATSNSARLAPACWFHSFPELASYPLARFAFVTPVRDDAYGQVGAQYTPLARPSPIAPSASICEGNSPVFAICAIFGLNPCCAACSQKVTKSGGM